MLTGKRGKEKSQVDQFCEVTQRSKWVCLFVKIWTSKDCFPLASPFKAPNKGLPSKGDTKFLQPSTYSCSVSLAFISVLFHLLIFVFYLCAVADVPHLYVSPLISFSRLLLPLHWVFQDGFAYKPACSTPAEAVPSTGARAPAGAGVSAKFGKP